MKSARAWTSLDNERMQAQVADGYDRDATVAFADKLNQAEEKGATPKGFWVTRRLFEADPQKEFIEAFRQGTIDPNAPTGEHPCAMKLALRKGYTALADIMLEHGGQLPQKLNPIYAANSNAWLCQHGIPIAPDDAVQFIQNLAFEKLRTLQLHGGRFDVPLDVMHYVPWVYHSQQHRTDPLPKAMSAESLLRFLYQETYANRLNAHPDHILSILEQIPPLLEGLDTAHREWDTFSAKPTPQSLTHASLIGFATIGKLDEAFEKSIWQGHEAKAVQLASALPPHLSAQLLQNHSWLMQASANQPQPLAWTDCVTAHKATSELGRW